MNRRRMLALAAVGLAAVVYLVGIVRLGAIERDGPAIFDLETRGGAPIRLHVPGERDAAGFLPVRPPDERPPVVVVAHGFSGDNNVMRALSRGLAESGYAAAAFDFRGHGGNRNPFRGDITDDVVDVVDALEGSAFVDADRVALLGHSMGASAVLGAAARDPRPAAVVGLSGARPTAERPRNALLVAASADPSRIRDGIARLADDLAGRETAQGRTYGSLSRGDAVRAVEIPGTDHLTILASDRALRESVRWLDAAFRIDRDEPIPPLESPRNMAVLPLLAALVLIAAIGRVGARAAPIRPVAPASRIPAGLVLLTLALVVAFPFVGPIGTGLPPLAVGDTVASHLLLAGALLLALRFVLLRRPTTAERFGTDRAPFDGLSRALTPALGATAAIVVVLAPVLAPFHRVAPTPPRLVAAIVTAVFLFPFFAATESLVRRGRPWAAALGGTASRFVVVAVQLVGAATGMLPGVIVLVVPLLIGLFVAMEVFAASAYSAGRNTAFVAVVDSLWLGWLFGVLLPVTI